MKAGYCNSIKPEGRWHNPPVGLREKLRRDRALIREQLTSGERAVAYAVLWLGALLPPVGVILAASSTTRGIGIGLLLLGLLILAVPISPFLKARIRKRERSASGE